MSNQIWGQTAPVADDEFAKNIRRVFAGDKVADIRLIFGYDDSKNFEEPWDPRRAQNFINYLESNSFKAMAITDDLARELGVPKATQNLRVFTGPGFQGETLRISLIWSAATSNTWLNIGTERNQQLLRSDEALLFMQKAATDADVQVYLGHSRAGGGPDTFPPVTIDNYKQGKRKVNFSHYKKTQPGLDALGASYKRARSKPYIIAWTSCKTDIHFLQWLTKSLSQKSNSTSLLLTTRLSYRNPN